MGYEDGKVTSDWSNKKRNKKTTYACNTQMYHNINLIAPLCGDMIIEHSILQYQLFLYI